MPTPRRSGSGSPSMRVRRTRPSCTTRSSGAATNPRRWQIRIPASWNLALRWLLLRQTMERTQAPDEFAAIDREDLASGEGGLQDRDRFLVVRISKRRQQHAAVRDVEIRVARRQAQ